MIGALQRWHLPWRRRPRSVPSAAPRPFDVAETHDGAADVWSISGEIDIATKPRLEAVLDAIGRDRAPLVLDLTDVTFMDSTGLSVLLRIQRGAEDAGRPLAIVCPEGPVRLLLAVTGIEEELPLYPTRAAALAART